MSVTSDEREIKLFVPELETCTLIELLCGKEFHSMMEALSYRQQTASKPME
jgi:hypothetical protein